VAINKTIELAGHHDERLRRFALAIEAWTSATAMRKIVIGLVEPCGIFRRLIIKPLWVFKLIVR
jgi:hypothetical protein